MKRDDAVEKLAEVIRRKHLALNTEKSYCARLKRHCDFIKAFPSHVSSEQKVERFLTALAKKDVSASSENQAFNGLDSLLQGVLGLELANVKSLRARRPTRLVKRRAAIPYARNRS